MDSRQRDDLLLAWHLNSASENERAWIEAELLRDPDFRACSDRLREVLRPLDHWTVSSPPAGLADRILDQINSPSAASQRTAKLNRMGESFAQERGWMPRLPALREWIAVAACVTLLASILVPAATVTRERARQAVCAANLGSVFQGVALYRSAFEGALPFAGNGEATAWLPAGVPDAPFASNSRHAFLLTQLNFGPKPEHFVCPSRKGDYAMAASAVADSSDFASAHNISYATLGMVGRNPALHPTAQVVFASDVNPLFVGGRFNEEVDPQLTNSPTHRGRGQNVLALDGSVEHLSSPRSGPSKDNIWLAGSLRRYRGTEAPVDDNDSFLIQGFPITDLAASDTRTR